MAHIYVVKNDRYNIYSTIVDDFLLDKGISKSELIAHVRREHGERQILYFINSVVPTIKEVNSNSSIVVPDGMTYDEYITKVTDGEYHE